jgi:hypothetical protein
LDTGVALVERVSSKLALQQGSLVLIEVAALFRARWEGEEDDDGEDERREGFEGEEEAPRGDWRVWYRADAKGLCSGVTALSLGQAHCVR